MQLIYQIKFFEGILVTVYVRDRNDLCQFVPFTRDACV